MEEKDRIMEEKDRILKDKDRILKDKDRIQKEKDRIQKEKDLVMKEKERKQSVLKRIAIRSGITELKEEKSLMEHDNIDKKSDGTKRNRKKTKSNRRLSPIEWSKQLIDSGKHNVHANAWEISFAPPFDARWEIGRG